MIEVKRFLTIFEAIEFCDSQPNSNLVTTLEFGWFIVWNAEVN